MTDKPIFPKPDPKRKQKIGFHSFTEEDFDAYVGLSKKIGMYKLL